MNKLMMLPRVVPEGTGVEGDVLKMTVEVTSGTGRVFTVILTGPAACQANEMAGSLLAVAEVLHLATGGKVSVDSITESSEKAN